MNPNDAFNDFDARRDAAERSVELIQENTQLTRQEALVAYENGQLAHIYDREPIDFEDCGDYER